MKAIKLVAEIYGKNAIPFLMEGLKDDNERVLDNTIETLGLFEERDLIPIFEKYKDYKINRVMGNAWGALIVFPEMEEPFLKKIMNVIKENDQEKLASLLYATGVKGKFLMESQDSSIIDNLCKENFRLKNILAFSLIANKKKKGLELYLDLFSLPPEKVLKSSIIHMFSQLNQEFRFDIIKYLVLNLDAEKYGNIIQILQGTNLDFTQEVKFFEILARQMKTQKAAV